MPDPKKVDLVPCDLSVRFISKGGDRWLNQADLVAWAADFPALAKLLLDIGRPQ